MYFTLYLEVVLQKLEKYLVVLLIACSGALLSYCAYYNEIWEGGGDNYWHYYFSKYAYQYPKFFLHHWGKPFFIFLSAPFSHFGFYGLNIFNILCGLGSAYVCYLYSKTLGFKASWLAPIILLFSVLYFLILQSAMTEPLFSLLLILSSFLFYKEKYLWASILASFLIYSRSEGMLMIILFACYLLLMRKWKFIPLMATAFSIYSFIGYFSGHDFLWFFTENPYAEVSVYGHGTWSHFFEKYKAIFGLSHTLLLILGLLTLLILIVKNKAYNLRKPLQREAKVAFLLVVPAIVFFMFHVYAWAMGKYASGGLERVMSCILPCTALLSMYPIHIINTLNINKIVLSIFNVTLAFFLLREPFETYHFPMPAWGPEKVEREASLWFKNVRLPNSMIYYAHPGIVFFCDEDPYNPDNKEAFAFPNDCEFKDYKHFYYVWDSQFSESSCHHSLQSLKDCNKLKLIKSFDKDEYFKMYFFEFTPQK